MDLSPVYDLKNSGLSQSLIGTFFSCPKRFLYKINGMEHVKKKESFFFGTMFHQALDDYFNLNLDPTDLGTWTDTFIAENFKLYASERSEIEIKAVVFEEVFDAYLQRFQMDTFQDVEIEFNELLFDKYRIRGKIDGLYQDKNGDLWVFETKTKSRITEDNLMLQLSFDFQTQFYTYICMQLGYKIKGVVYNVIRVPGERKGKGTLQDLRDKIRAKIKKIPDYYFMRYEIPFSKRDIRLFRVELKNKLDHIQQCIDKNDYYKIQGSCIGAYTCEFLNVCGTGSFEGFKITGNPFPELNTTIKTSL